MPYKNLISLLYAMSALLQGLVLSNLPACILSLVHSPLKVLVLISYETFLSASLVTLVEKWSFCSADDSGYNGL